MRGTFQTSIVIAWLLTTCALPIGLARPMEEEASLGTSATRTVQARTVQANEPTDEKAGSAGETAGTPAAVLDARDVESILGKNVRGANSGENMGRIVDVIVSRAGTVRGVVIDFGGFLGVGSRKIAVDWNALRFNPADKSGSITVDLTRDQLRSAPEYKAGEPVVILGAAAPVAAPGSPPPAQEK